MNNELSHDLSPITYEQNTIALLHWGDLIEDFLESIGISFEEFCEEMTGGWMFGYIEALKSANVRTVLFCISAKVTETTRYTHKPTGATICVLPAPAIYHSIRRPMKNPYGWGFEDVFGNVKGVRRLWYPFLKDGLSYLATPVQLLANELKREKCTAILCQEYEYPRFDVCVFLGKWLKIPVFATFQGGNFQLSRLEKPLRPLTLHTCAGVIVATQTERERLQIHYKISPDKIAAIFNPLNLKMWQAIDKTQARQELQISPEAKVVVWHGRVDIYRKGLDILLDAWQQVIQQHPNTDVQLLLIGTGSDAEQLQTRLAKMQLRGLTWINEYILDRPLMCKYLSAADIYTLPSRHEGFPVAPLEAMACGLPVVASAAPGVPDILAGEEQAGGLLVPREDANALASALSQLLDHPALREKLSQRAQNRIKTHFSLEAVGQQLREFLYG